VRPNGPGGDGGGGVGGHVFVVREA